MALRGKLMGSYNLLDELGRGGMGTVYLAEHIETGQVVALKTVRLAKRKLLSQLRREIDTLSQIKHPGIVGIVDQGVHGGRPWYAMELVTGTTLRDYLREGHPASSMNSPQEDSLLSYEILQDVDSLHSSYDSIEWSEKVEKTNEQEQTSTNPSFPPRFENQQEGSSTNNALVSWKIPQEEGGTKPNIVYNLQSSLKAAYGLCITLAYLHGEGIVHCDLKPENIILESDGWPVLIDFGLLVQFAGSVNREVLQVAQEGAGTLPYMSPEQINGELLDARSDIYAMGCILYELLVGKPPFVGHHYDVVAQHMFDAPVLPSKKVQGIPPGLDELILRMLAKDRKDRIGYADIISGYLESIEPSLRPQAPFGIYQLRNPITEDEPEFTPRLRLTASESTVPDQEDTVPEIPRVTPTPDDTLPHATPAISGDATIPMNTFSLSSPDDMDDRKTTQTPIPFLELPLPRVYLYRPGLTGREEAWNSLTEKVNALRKKEGSELVLLGSPSGLGKTRMVLELAHYAQGKQLQIITSRCLDYFSPAMSIFHPFLEAMGDKMREREGFEFPLHQAESNDNSSLATLIPSEPEQLFILGSQAPSHAHLRIYRTLLQQLETYSSEQPLLFLIDDLHLADELSLGALAFLTRPNTLPNVLFVGTYRTEECPISLQMLINQKSVTDIKIEQLSNDDITAIVGEMLAMPQVPEQLANTLTRYAKGNPYFVAEYLHVAVAEGLLQRDMGGQWLFDSLLEANPTHSSQDLSLNVPKALRTLVLRRISKLPSEAQRILALTSTIGREAPISLVQLASDIPVHKWWKLIEPIQRLLILDITERDTLSFSHEQFRDSIYSDIPTAAKVIYHQKIASVIEEHWSREIEAYYPTLAYHWHKANETTKACSYYKKAAEQAQAQLVPAESIRWYRAYLGIQSSSMKEYFTVKFALADLLTSRGHIEEAHKELSEALQLTLKHYKPFTEAEVHLRLAKLYWHQSKHNKSRKSSEEALQLYKQLGDRKGVGATLAHLGHCAYYQSNWEEARQRYQEAMALYRKADEPLEHGKMMLNQARLYNRQGKLNEARELCQNAMTIFHELNASRFEALSLEQMASIELFQDRLEQAQKLIQRALQILHHVGDRFQEGIALSTAAHILQNDGKIEESLALYDEAIQQHQELQSPLFAAVNQLHRTSLSRLLGFALDPLEDELLRVEEFLQQTKDPFYLSILYCEQGHLALAKHRSANSFLQKARRTLASAHINPYANTEAGIRLRRLSDAQSRFSKKLKLFHGEDLSSLPTKLHKALLQRKS